MKIYNNITEVFGNTPLVRINKIMDGAPANVFAKLEFYNPTSTVKDRLGIAMVDAAERSGALKPGGTIVEATSGNTGIAVAMVAAARGYKAILTMPESVSKERRKLIKAFGAELVLTPAALGMKGAVAASEELAATGAVLVRQFENEAGPAIHYATTGEEIWRDTNGVIDAVVLGVGTGGTLTGVGEVLKARNPKLHVVAVEPENSPVLSGGTHAPHLIQGIGAGFVADVLDRSLIDEVMLVSNDEAIGTTQRLAALEGIAAGISSGAALACAMRLAARPEMKGRTVVTLLPDSAERYLSTALLDGYAQDPA